MQNVHALSQPTATETHARMSSPLLAFAARSASTARFRAVRFSVLFACGVALAGCSLFESAPESTRTSSNRLPPLRPPPGAMQLDVAYIEWPADDSKLREELWRHVDQVGPIEAETRGQLRENGVRVGVVGTNPPLVLQRMRQLVHDDVPDREGGGVAADLQLLGLGVVEADHAAGQQLLLGVLGVEARRQQAEGAEHLRLPVQVGVGLALQLHDAVAEGPVGEVPYLHRLLELEAPVGLHEADRLRHERVDRAGGGLRAPRGRQQPVDPVHPRHDLISQHLVDLARAHAVGPGSGIGLHLDHPHSKPAFARADDVGTWF